MVNTYQILADDGSWPRDFPNDVSILDPAKVISVAIIIHQSSRTDNGAMLAPVTSDKALLVSLFHAFPLSRFPALTLSPSHAVLVPA